VRGWYDRGVDEELARQALRLALGAELTHRAVRVTGSRIAAGADLAALARALPAIAAPVERAHRLRFAPAYPGVTGGVEELRGARRLVLACTASDDAGEPAAVLFTTLISGRAPQVAAAPAGAPIPPGWTAVAPG
jgi:hypothetical protein